MIASMRRLVVRETAHFRAVVLGPATGSGLSRTRSERWPPRGDRETLVAAVDRVDGSLGDDDPDGSSQR
jgi:hypothetical protein